MLSKLVPIFLISSLVFGIFLPLPSASASVAASTDWDMIGQAGGPTQGIAVQGIYAYIGVGQRLMVIDISNPTNPRQVGASTMLDDFVLGVTVSGTRAYVAAGNAGLLVVDIANPLDPAVIGAWNSPGFAENVAISGSIAYLADGPYGLRVVDISNPTAPVEVANAFDMNYAVDVTVSGRYAFIAAGGAGLLVAEISNPLFPIEAGTYDTPDYARSVSASGSLVLLADERGGLLILDAADPFHPALLGSLQTEGWAFDVTISGSLAYVAAAFGGLRLVNINNPAAPVELGNISWPQSNAGGVITANGRVFIADRKGGLRVVEAYNPASPVQISYWNVLSFAHSVEVDDNYAYVAAGFNGVRIFSLSNPAHPVEVGSFIIDGLFYALKLSGTRLFAGTMINSPETGIYVLDISDPTHPQQIGYYSDIAECWAIDVAGNTVYVADAGDLKIFDFSHPPSMNLIGSYPLVPRGLTVRNGLAYVSQEFNGLNIYNVSNPAAISFVGSFQGANTFTHGPVGLSGNHAYITEQGGLRILDITNPAAPTEVSYTPTHDETNWLVLNGSRVYVSEGSYGFSVYDVSVPAAPQLISQTSLPGAVQVLALNNGRLFTASGEGGLQVFSEAAITTPTLPNPLPQTRQQMQTMFITAPSYHNPRADFVPDISVMPPVPDRLAGTCTVTQTANSGPGTLRSCLENQVSGDVITFSPTIFPPSAPATIFIGPVRLPWLTHDNITIDASNAGVILNGNSIPGGWDPGIGISSNNNTVRGLQIVNFPIGINVLGNNNTIGGSRLVGNGPSGQGNVLAGNRGNGISMDLGAEANLIIGNLVGVTVSGTQAYPNAGSGVNINQSPKNIVGSLNPGEDNIISANLQMGVILYGYATLDTKIIGNKVGTDITGNFNLGNHNVGLYVESGSANTLVHGNLISGNSVAEVYVWDFGTDFNVLTGNYIGTNQAGDAALPGLTDTGIATGNAAYTRIGGTALGEGNVVANPGGVGVDAPFGANTRVTGNHLGLNAAGAAVLDSAGGLRLTGATRSIIGGATLAEANYITTDGHFSLQLRSPDNVIAGNFMGLAVDGVTPLATASFQILSLRDGNTIQGNHLANATSAGIWVDGAQSNTIRRNSIYANPFMGIFLDNGANTNLTSPNFSLSVDGGSGTTCPGCTIELFLDAENQGLTYLDSRVADGMGAFQFPALCPLHYPNITATTTDLQGNTSGFSSPQEVPWDCTSARPTPTLASLYPTSQTAFAATFRLTLSGADFYADSVARWDGITLPTTVVSSSLAQAVVPSFLFQAGGEYPVTIYTPAPGGGESGTLQISIAPPKNTYLPMVHK